MMDRGAVTRWRHHLQEVLGMEDADEIVDPIARTDWPKVATEDSVRDVADQLRFELQAAWRKDLLTHFTGQTFALAAAVAAVLALG